MDSYMAISSEGKGATARRLRGEKKKKQSAGMEYSVDGGFCSELRKLALPGNSVDGGFRSGLRKLAPPRNSVDGGFCSGLRKLAPPGNFPLLAVIPGWSDIDEMYRGLKDPYETFRFTFVGFKSRDRYEKIQVPLPCEAINLSRSRMSIKDGWILFLLLDDTGVICNPDTREIYYLPSDSYVFGKGGYDRVYLVNVADTSIAFAAFHTGMDGCLALAAASPGDSMWSLSKLSQFESITDIIFHKADGKFYAMDINGHLLSFRLRHRILRRGKTTTVVVLDGMTRAISEESSSSITCAAGHSPRLFTDGTNLLQSRAALGPVVGKYKIFKYHFDEDRWIAMANIDLGDNSLFIDYYEAKLLPCCPAPPPPIVDHYKDGHHHEEEEEGGRLMMMMRRNCIYSFYDETIPSYADFQDWIEQHEEKERKRKAEAEKKGYSYEHWDFHDPEYETVYVPSARRHDASTGVVETCFITDIQSDCRGSTNRMWFMPYSSLPPSTTN